MWPALHSPLFTHALVSMVRCPPELLDSFPPCPHSQLALPRDPRRTFCHSPCRSCAPPVRAPPRTMQHFLSSSMPCCHFHAPLQSTVLHCPSCIHAPPNRAPLLDSPRHFHPNSHAPLQSSPENRAALSLMGYCSYYSGQFELAFQM